MKTNRKFEWVKYKNRRGVRHYGIKVFEYADYYSEGSLDAFWGGVLNVVSESEGNFDTVISYDGTGITFGFMQWTFTSGRLQKFLESLKAIEVLEFTHQGKVPRLFEVDASLFSLYCDQYPADYWRTDPRQTFEEFGFKIKGGAFCDLARDTRLLPGGVKGRKRIDDICTGKVSEVTKKRQKNFMLALARLFAKMGESPDIQLAQISFAEAEFRRAYVVKRAVLKGKSIKQFLREPSVATPVVALFFNLWQNNPGAAYRLFRKALKHTGTEEELFSKAWELANKSRFGNWGWKAGKNKTPRVMRIKKAIQNTYGIKLKYYK